MPILLSAPLSIGPNLEPAVRIGDSWLSIRYGDIRDNRRVYVWTLIRPDRPDVTRDDVQSGMGGGTLREGFTSLLSFLSVFGAAETPEDEHWDLFPDEIREWAQEYQDDIGLLQYEIEENPDCLQEAARYG